MGDRARQSGSAAQEDSALHSFTLLLSFLDRPADPEQFRHSLGKGSAPTTADEHVLSDVLLASFFLQILAMCSLYLVRLSRSLSRRLQEAGRER
jgi:hypothetical protein